MASENPALAVLVPYVAEDTRFRVLTLSADSVRLLEGTINSLGEADLGPIPADCDSIFGHVENQEHLQHSSSRDGSPYHGHASDVCATPNACRWTLATERINEAWAKDQALLDTHDIIRAAGEGRVDSPFLTAGAVTADPRLEQAVRLTLQMGGEVHALADGDRLAAALLRY